MEIAETTEYLSIGEVLSQLKVEFEEVSISKIRFLEAQGLMRLERSPAGYRQFYPVDIARLRWILRQQRDHFLPLKVIKSRLDELGDVDFEESIPVQPNLFVGTDDDPNRPVREAEAAAEAAIDVEAWERLREQDEADRAAAERVSEAPASRRRSARKRPAKTATTAATATPEAAESNVAPPVDHSAHHSVGHSVDHSTHPSAQTATLAGTVPAAKPDSTEAGVDEGARETGDGEHEAAAWLAALQESPASPRGRRDPRTERAEEQAAVAIGRGLTFGRGEVLELAEIDEATLSMMEEYGFVSVNVIAGESTYDAAALAVVKSLKRFLAKGVEPRHLRMFKNAAERESGFYEQMVLPLLKQRNPRAIEQATALLNELAGAGEQLHRALVHQALGRYRPD